MLISGGDGLVAIVLLPLLVLIVLIRLGGRALWIGPESQSPSVVEVASVAAAMAAPSTPFATPFRFPVTALGACDDDAVTSARECG